MARRKPRYNSDSAYPEYFKNNELYWEIAGLPGTRADLPKVDGYQTQVGDLTCWENGVGPTLEGPTDVIPHRHLVWSVLTSHSRDALCQEHCQRVAQLFEKTAALLKHIASSPIYADIPADDDWLVYAEAHMPEWEAQLNRLAAEFQLVRATIDGQEEWVNEVTQHAATP